MKSHSFRSSYCHIKQAHHNTDPEFSVRNVPQDVRSSATGITGLAKCMYCGIGRHLPQICSRNTPLVPSVPVENATSLYSRGQVEVGHLRWQFLWKVSTFNSAAGVYSTLLNGTAAAFAKIYPITVTIQNFIKTKFPFSG